MSYDHFLSFELLNVDLHGRLPVLGYLGFSRVEKGQ